VSERPATRLRVESFDELERHSLSPQSFYSLPPVRPARTTPAPFPVSPLLSRSTPLRPSRYTASEADAPRRSPRPQAPPDDQDAGLTFFDDWRGNAVEAVANAATSISVYDDFFRAKVIVTTPRDGASVLLDMIDVLVNADNTALKLWKPPRHSPACSIPPHISAFFHPVAFNSFSMCVPTSFLCCLSSHSHIQRPCTRPRPGARNLRVCSLEYC
jgi:hypothetical protein